MTNKYRISACAAAIMLALSGCGAGDAPQSGGRWKTPLHQDHVLTGKIWRTSAGRYATVGEIYAAMKKADFVLIGEKHDNADHHFLQAKLISEITAYRRSAAVVFEMLTESQQAALDAHLVLHPADADGLGAAVGWQDSGWPDWEIYKPIAEQALNGGMAMLAGGLDRETTKEIARQGPNALGEDRAARMMLDMPITEDMRAEMREEIFQSHCRQLPEPMLDPMVSVTLAKDAVMADRMIEAREAPENDLSVLIAGGGHVRKDWGVPMHLARRVPGSRIVSIGLLEVDKDTTDPTAYAGRFGSALPFDFVWFTPRVDDDDPCEVFAEQLRRIREQKQDEGEAGAN